MDKDSFNVGAFYTLLKRFIAICFCVLMSVAGVKSTVEKHGISGQDAKLFKIDHDCADPTLYKDPEIFVASWDVNTSTVFHMNHHYSGKIFMDKKRNILMYDVERKDAGKYYLKCGRQSKGLEMTLTVDEELTEEQPQECPNNCPDFTKEAPDNPGRNMLGLLALLIIPVLAVIYVLYRKKILSCETTPKRQKRSKTDKVEVPRTELELRQWIDTVATSTSVDELCRNQDHNQVPNMQESLEDKGKQKAILSFPVQAEHDGHLDSVDTNSVIIEIMEP